jgi:protocatechuate 3,4-dioxygenase beta subunit
LLVCGLLAIAVVAAGAATNNTPFHFSGTVVSSEGRPVSGATIVRYEQDQVALRPTPKYRQTLEVTTGADGKFDLALPRESTVFVAHGAGLAPAWRQSWNARKDLKDQQLVLKAPVNLAGMVVDEADKPVADAEVFVLTAVIETALPGGGNTFSYLQGALGRDLFHARTGADGRFQIDGFPVDVATDLAVAVKGKAMRNPGRESIGPDTMPWRGGDRTIKLVVEPAGSIQGKVVVQEGSQPLGDVPIVLQPHQGGYFGPAVAESVRSSADGTFVISDVAAGIYQIRAEFRSDPFPDWAAEGVPVTVETGKTTQGVQIAAVRGGVLQISVNTSANHQAIAEANVNAYKEDFQAAGKSGTNGVVWLRVLPGDYQISAYQDRWRGDPVPASVQAGETNRVEVELSPLPKIIGIVRRPDGQPAVGAEVKVMGGGPMDTAESKTDAGGRFEAEWDPRRFGRMGSSTCVLVCVPENGWAVAQDIDEETGSLELRLAPSLTFVGEVKSAEGQVITNATAALVFWTGNRGMHLSDLGSRTNAPGHFEITTLPPGRHYGLFVTAPGFGQRSMNQLPADTGEGKVDLGLIELNVAKLKLAGQLLKADDTPVPGAFVSLQGEGQPNAHVRTDRNGRFKFDQVCEGPVQLFASIANSFGNTSAQGGDTNVVLRLNDQQMRSVTSGPARVIKGVVTDPDDKQVPGARVRLFSPMDFERQWSRADSNGAYRVTSSRISGQAGTLWLIARDSLGKLAAAEELVAETNKVDLKLQPANVIAAQVQDLEGNPVAKATIDVMLSTGRMQGQWDEKPVQPNGQGQLAISGLPSGVSFVLYASAPGYGRVRQEVSLDEGTGPRVSLPAFVLKKANMPLQGQVVNEDQKPVPNVQVQVNGEDQPQTFATTDRQGRFKLQVCDGPARLFAYSGERFSQGTFDAGETNALMTLTPQTRATRELRQRRSLLGKPLPDLAAVGLATNTVPAGQPALICLLDFEQKHSRRALRQLTEQLEELKDKHLTTALVQVALSSDETWQDLKTSVSSQPFTLGRVAAKSAQNRWATDITLLPWLILVDKQGRVAAEGFSSVDLPERLKGLETVRP